jgi:hypothetical protein
MPYHKGVDDPVYPCCLHCGDPCPVKNQHIYPCCCQEFPGEYNLD